MTKIIIQINGTFCNGCRNLFRESELEEYHNITEEESELEELEIENYRLKQVIKSLERK